MNKMKLLPTDNSNFKSMILGDYIYVDKTQYIYDLFMGGSRYYFLSRPRRFGKTLLVSTLKEFFLGNKELFNGLKISQTNYDWTSYPVIHLDFSGIPHSSVDEFKKALEWELELIAQSYGIDISDAPFVESKLKSLVLQLASKSKLSDGNHLVLLVDEYDKPIIDNLSDIEEAESIRKSLKSFFEIVKSLDAHWRAIFITGVTKFSKTSIFSGLNNLNDLTTDIRASSLLGYTQNELEYYFSNNIVQIADNMQITEIEVSEKVRQWYNGYRFSSSENRVYNPFSILRCFDRKEFLNYWFESGTPSFLIPFVDSEINSLEKINEIEVDIGVLGTYEISSIPFIPLLFQTGYLTIKDYNKSNSKVTLGFPNLEVHESFGKYLIQMVTKITSYETESLYSVLESSLINYDLVEFFKILKSIFFKIPHSLDLKESGYHAVFVSLLVPLDIEINSEIMSRDGRVDSMVETPDYIYIFEFKLNKEPSIALNQIHDKKYYDIYSQKNKKIILVGVSFLKFKGSNFDLKYECEELEK